MKRKELVYHYFTVESEGVAEFKDRGSRFLAIVFPMETKTAFKNKLQQLKSEHPKAVHHCFAYRLGQTGDDFRVSDDGEPSGTAGRPILGQIDSRKLTSCGVIVVRYFGGTLLGVPGLIKAYKSATALVLQTTPIVQKPVLVHISVEFEYTRQNEVMQILRLVQAKISERKMQLFCTVSASIPLSYYDEAIHRLQDRGLNFFTIE